MSQSLSSIRVLLLLMMCCICGPAYAESAVEPKSVELFVRGKTKVPFKETNGTVTEKDVKVFYPLFLVSADGVMVTFAATSFTDNDGKGNIDIAAKYIGTKAEDWAMKAMENDGNNWKTQLVIQNEVSENLFVVLQNPMTVVKGNKISLLAVICNISTSESPSQIQNSDFLFAEGEVTGNTGTEKTMNWKAQKSLSSKLAQQFRDESLTLFPPSGRGYSFLTQDGKIVFVLGAMRDGKDGFAIIHLNATGDDTEWGVFFLENVNDCFFSFFFEWEGKLIMVSYCSAGTHTVKASIDMGKTWTNVEGSLFRLLGIFKEKGDFTIVTIDNKTVLLFTERSSKGSDSQEKKYEVHLLMTDGSRVCRVGPIVVDAKPVISSGLLYTNDELFFLHQRWNNEDNDSGTVVLTRLKDQLEKMKSVLKSWDEMDKYLSTPCIKTTPQGTLCVTPMPTDGLVGFLSNTTSDDDDNIWVDEYFYVNATVKGGTKVDNGFTFSGTNAGAQWPIGSQGQSQLYNFSRYGLTVVATVTIHEVPKSDSPLLTIDRIPSNKPLGLWYGSNKKWKVVSMNSDGAPGSGWEINKSYRVTIMLNDDNVSAYVDGELLGDPLQISSPEEDLLGIGYIFIGHKKDSEENKNTEGSVTVTNVLLYNRPLSTSELDALGKKRAETIESKGHAGDTTESKGHAGDTTESKGHAGDTIESKGHAGDTIEPKGQTGDTIEPKGQTGDTIESKGQVGDTIESKGHAGDTIEPKGQTGDTIEPKGQTGDTIESKGQVGDTIESKGHAGDTIESKGHAGDTIESKEHAGDTTESKGHAGDTIESKGHAGDTIESKEHAGDTTESKGHTGQSPEGGKDLQQFLKLTNSQDSCVYMPVVTSLLCLLGLWGLTVFC